jgi:hypothetical protein
MTEMISRADVMSGIETPTAVVPDGYSSYTGAPYEDNPVLLPDPPPDYPVITRLSPTSVAVGAAPLTLYAVGANFVDPAVLVFNGGDEISTTWPEGMVSTGLQPDTATAPVTVPVHVRNPDGLVSNTVMFTFTPAIPEVVPLENDASALAHPSPTQPADPGPADVPPVAA